ncbi:MAG: N-acetyl-gamma-glutamyl-phosphate reductase [Planctomycetes bacterium]|nr:N-acetyl-gamma-glutamyl-phosphate reductase [Planctomycetota bacterium]
MIRAAVVGAAGYAGGELARLLSGHPEVELAQVTSSRLAGRWLHAAHPNLRGVSELRFVDEADLAPCDVLFLALGHGEAAQRIERYAGLAERVVDLSADFRLNDAAAYERWYGAPHPAPEWLGRFTYGLPEVSREALRGARYASGVGCNATAANLALLPLARSGVLERVVLEVKVGSSEGGAQAGPASHHPERAGCLRSFAPTGHRHQAELELVLGPQEVHFSATAVERVRGVLCTAHAFLTEDLEEKDVWRLYREHYASEPFVRLVKERTGLYRYPEPKLLAGTNWCDVGFERDPASRRLVVMSALDNLMKGAAGTAVQCMNLMCGLDETAGLGFPGLHPCE